MLHSFNNANSDSKEFSIDVDLKKANETHADVTQKKGRNDDPDAQTPVKENPEDEAKNPDERSNEEFVKIMARIQMLKKMRKSEGLDLKKYIRNWIIDTINGIKTLLKGIHYWLKEQSERNLLVLVIQVLCLCTMIPESLPENLGDETRWTRIYEFHELRNKIWFGGAVVLLVSRFFSVHCQSKIVSGLLILSGFILSAFYAVLTLLSVRHSVLSRRVYSFEMTYKLVLFPPLPLIAVGLCGLAISMVLGHNQRTVNEVEESQLSVENEVEKVTVSFGKLLIWLIKIIALVIGLFSTVSNATLLSLGQLKYENSEKDCSLYGFCYYYPVFSNQTWIIQDYKEYLCYQHLADMGFLLLVLLWLLPSAKNWSAQIFHPGPKNWLLQSNCAIRCISALTFLVIGTAILLSCMKTLVLLLGLQDAFVDELLPIYYLKYGVSIATGTTLLAKYLPFPSASLQILSVPIFFILCVIYYYIPTWKVHWILLALIHLILNILKTRMSARPTPT